MRARIPISIWLMPWLLACGGEASTGVVTDLGDVELEVWVNDPLCPDIPPAFAPPNAPLGCSAGLECRFDAVGCEPGERPEIVCLCDATGWRCGPWARNCLPLGSETSKLWQGERPRPKSRPAAVVCDNPAEADRTATCWSESGDRVCDGNADCDNDEVCLYAATQGFAGACQCMGAECLSDAECGATQVCACGSLANDYLCGEPYSERPCSHRCVTAACKTDDDCPGGFCSPSFDVCGTRIERWACHDPSRDECLSDAECRHSDAGWAVCRADPDGAWRCKERTLACEHLAQ